MIRLTSYRAIVENDSLTFLVKFQQELIPKKFIEIIRRISFKNFKPKDVHLCFSAALAFNPFFVNFKEPIEKVKDTLVGDLYDEEHRSLRDYLISHGWAVDVQ